MDASTDELFSQLRASMGSGSEGSGVRDLRRRAGAIVVGVVAVACVVVGVSWLRPVETAGAPAPAPARASGSLEVPAAASTSTVPAAEPARVWPDEPVAVEGNEVRAGGQRWSVGDAGDLVAVGDWDCNGTKTPAVLRPSAARLFLFEAWADAAAVPGPDAPNDAVTFRADGCGRASVTTSSGSSVVVETTEDR